MILIFGNSVRVNKQLIPRFDFKLTFLESDLQATVDALGNLVVERKT